MSWVGRDRVGFWLQGRILDGGQFTLYYSRMTIGYCFRGYSVIIVVAEAQMALGDAEF